MARLFKVLALSKRERTLLVEALFLLVFARIGLRTMPFVTLKHILSKLATNRARTGDIVCDNRVRSQILWAVATAGRQVPLASTCLTRALAVQVLLARSGDQSDLRIGVTRDSNGKFLAHAWLEKQGDILIGGDCSNDFTLMPTVEVLEL
jgi:transglutaminase superfamily protein